MKQELNGTVGALGLTKMLNPHYIEGEGEGEEEQKISKFNLKFKEDSIF